MKIKKYALIFFIILFSSPIYAFSSDNYKSEVLTFGSGNNQNSPNFLADIISQDIKGGQSSINFKHCYGFYCYFPEIETYGNIKAVSSFVSLMAMIFIVTNKRRDNEEE